MKKIIVAVLLVCTIQMNAQDQDKSRMKNERKEYKKAMNDMTPEQIAELRTKKMTLALDLSDAQQQQVFALNTRMAKDKKQKMKARKLAKENNKEFTSDERFAMMNERLDTKIAFKKDIKQILSSEQYKRWEKMQARKGKRKHKGKREKK